MWIRLGLHIKAKTLPENEAKVQASIKAWWLHAVSDEKYFCNYITTSRSYKGCNGNIGYQQMDCF